jgi:hypothetical protein
MRPVAYTRLFIVYHTELAKQNTLAPQVEEQSYASTLQLADSCIDYVAASDCRYISWRTS